jgi:hypothetical protein
MDIKGQCFRDNGGRPGSDGRLSDGLLALPREICAEKSTANIAATLAGRRLWKLHLPVFNDLHAAWTLDEASSNGYYLVPTGKSGRAVKKLSALHRLVARPVQTR